MHSLIRTGTLLLQRVMEEIRGKKDASVATDKKLFISRFNNYKIVRDKSIMEQLHKIEHILNNYKLHNIYR